MPTRNEILAALNAKASEKTRVTYMRHGAPPSRTLGVSVAEMKTIAKTIKKQQALACELYATGLFDAMYLAGMVADGRLMTKQQLDAWAQGAAGSMIFEHTVPWVAVESEFARELAVEWIGSKQEHVASAGWCTYAGMMKTWPDDRLDLAEIKGLLKGIPVKIQDAMNRVRYTMNGFVIAAGGHVAPLHKEASAAAERLGMVFVDVGDTACLVPLATEHIAKVHASGKAAKQKTIRC